MSSEGVPTWEEIARDYGRFLYNVAYRLTGNDDDARDLVQEVLLRVRRGLRTVRRGCTPRQALRAGSGDCW